MSMGIGGHARLILEDSEYVVYEYGGYNLDDPQYRNADHVYDGTITIHKSAFSEPEIHTKIKRRPSGRKQTVSKRIIREAPICSAFGDGKVAIENCGNCQKKIGDDGKDDYIAVRLVYKILRQYQENGTIPQKAAFDV